MRPVNCARTGVSALRKIKMNFNRRDFFKGSATAVAGTAIASCRNAQSSEIPEHRWIDQNLCVGCGNCISVCPMGAIRLQEKSQIDPNECAECGVCFRSRVCPKNAIKEGNLKYPRTLRETFSNPMTGHKSTGVAGRGTEEIKTNDTTNRYGPGMMGIYVELGRPVLGARFKDVERVVKKLRQYGYSVIADNPVAELIVDPQTGALKPEILNEKAISVLVEFLLPRNAVPAVQKIIQELSLEIETVFSLSVALRALPDGRSPFRDLFGEEIFSLPNGKVNLGLAEGIAEKEI